MRHHFVPAFYQRNWAINGNKLVVYSMPRPGKVVSSDLGPEGAGWEEDLYAIGNINPEITHYLETVFLQAVDSLSADAMHHLLEFGTKGLSVELRTAWTRFVINTMVRHPEAFAEIRFAVEKRWNVTDQETEEGYQRLRTPDMPAQFSDFMVAQGEEWETKLKITLIKGLLDNEYILNRLLNMSWTILNVGNSDFELLTSDQPLLKSVRGDRMVFILPMSPKVAFMAVTHSDDAQAVTSRSFNDFARMLNGYVVRRARRFVFASNRHQSRFIERHMSAEKQEGEFFPGLSRQSR